MKIPIADADRVNILGKLLPILLKENNNGIIKAMSTIKESILYTHWKQENAHIPMKALAVIMHAIYRKGA